MKKVYLSALLAFSIVMGGGAAFAQQSVSGFPKSMGLTAAEAQTVTQISFDRPDYEGIVKEANERELSGLPGPYMVSTFVASDISLYNSGTWSYLDDGSKIWRLSLTVPDAKAIGLLYDQFRLPEGVQLFISNNNGRQVIGAYTSMNNNEEYGNFAHQPVQGSTANIEMDIPAGVSVEDIVFHIDKVSAFYRSVNHLTRLYGDNGSVVTPAKPTDLFDPGASATCNVDANCEIETPLAKDDYNIPKRASVRILINGSGGQGFCSGTLINNTGNGKNNTCIPYVLTASHCDGNNSYSSSNFSQWLFTFNFRYDSCGSGDIEGSSMSSVLTGADFKARSYFPSIGGTSDKLSLVGDFLLLQLKVKPNSYGTYYAGWNRNTDIAFDPSSDFFIGFHYPAGDVEKLSWGTSIQSNGTFNQFQVHSTHWRINFAVGGTQGGSSGSGLFDVNGRLIGDLSGGQQEGCPPGQGGNFGREGLYSKISYAWDNQYDQDNHSSHAGPQSRLKDWLDPINSGAKTLDALKPDCTSATSIQQLDEEELGNGIQVYPTPSATGMIHVKTKLAEPTALSIGVYNALGRLVKSFTLPAAYQGTYSVDCSNLADGLYMMKFSGEHASTTKKILIAR